MLFSALHGVVCNGVHVRTRTDFFEPLQKATGRFSIRSSIRDVETLKLAGVDFIPRRMTENIATGLHLFDVLEQDGRIGPHNLDLLQDMLQTVGRVDLARKIQAFVTASVKGEIDGKLKSLNTHYQPEDQDFIKRAVSVI